MLVLPPLSIGSTHTAPQPAKDDCGARRYGIKKQQDDKLLNYRRQRSCSSYHNYMSYHLLV